MTIYITRHALTDGIIEATASITTGGIAMTDEHVGATRRYYPGEWWYDRADAVEEACRMRDARAADLERQRDAITRKTF